MTAPPLTRDGPIPGRALAIAAHPDDVEFGAGATLAKWAAAGCVINHLILTDGSKGTWDPHADPVALVARRRVEQRDAADALGSTGEVVMAGWVDGELDTTLERRETVARWIRKLRPDVVLGHDPWKRYRLHPDHRHAGWLTVDAVVAARDPHFHPEHGTGPHRPQALLLFEADEINHVETVGDLAVEAKLEALLAHRSQWRSTMFIDADDDGTQQAAFRQRVLDELAAAGALVDRPRGEAFHAITDL